ncbi:MAG: hypothetical protein HYY16_15960, partial [Planctomycetes bacterium]|nr:hypothetical protein [Planctomycetota bacterium]
LIIGKGERMEPGRSETLEAGALLFEPADTVHSTQAKTDVILLIHAEGPLDTKYLNPREDPSRQP